MPQVVAEGGVGPRLGGDDDVARLHMPLEGAPSALRHRPRPLAHRHGALGVGEEPGERHRQRRGRFDAHEPAGTPEATTAYAVVPPKGQPRVGECAANVWMIWQHDCNRDAALQC